MVDIFEKAKLEDKEIDLDDNFAKFGDDVNITAKDPTLRRVLVGAGWDLNAFNSEILDLDISVILIDKDGMTREDEEFVFYNNLEAYDGAVKHNGDSRTGAGDGDDETISIDLQGLPFDIMKCLFVFSIYKGQEKKHELRQVRNIYIRIVNEENGHELIRYEMDKDLEDHAETAVIAASLNREGPKWHFTPVCDFAEGGLGEIASRYGLVIVSQ